MIDWDEAFDNTGHVPGAAELPAQWAEAAATYRAEMDAAGRLRPEQPYGPDPRERLDLVLPAGEARGAVVFVHGGYWRRFDKSYWTHLAAGAAARGWAVAVPSYPLAPEARIAEITTALARAVAAVAAEVAGPLRLVGHSAGGHLVTRMLCPGVLPEAVAARLARVTSVSGVHDLAPLVATSMNDTLRLDPQEAAAESPARCRPRPGVPVTVWVGAQERPEFLRQARLLEEAWAKTGAEIAAVYEPGHHHFSVVAGLTSADSRLVQAVLR
jgi:acetyl esterase/lipase